MLTRSDMIPLDDTAKVSHIGAILLRDNASNPAGASHNIVIFLLTTPLTRSLARSPIRRRQCLNEHGDMIAFSLTHPTLLIGLPAV